MIKVGELFDVCYGVNLELNALVRMQAGINFVSRTAKNNGVSARVRMIEGVEPNPAGSISVAGGGSVMESFLQPTPYYSGRDLYYLVPKISMSVSQKLFYCTCLRANKYRYNYGRQANRTLKDILIPDIHEIPAWVNTSTVSEDFRLRLESVAILSTKVSKRVAFTIGPGRIEVGNLFDISYGHSMELNRLQTCAPDEGVAFVSRKMGDNGIAAYVVRINDIEPGEPFELTCALSGNGVLSTFVQEQQFYTGFHVARLRPKVALTLEEKLFYCMCIRANRFRYSYGRQANRTLSSLIVPSPDSIPAWVDGGLQRLTDEWIQLL